MSSFKIIFMDIFSLCKNTFSQPGMLGSFGWAWLPCNLDVDVDVNVDVDENEDIWMWMWTWSTHLGALAMETPSRLSRSVCCINHAPKAQSPARTRNGGMELMGFLGGMGGLGGAELLARMNL